MRLVSQVISLAQVGTDFDATLLKIMIGNIELSPLAVATFVAVFLNLVIPEPKVKAETPILENEVKEIA